MKLVPFHPSHVPSLVEATAEVGVSWLKSGVLLDCLMSNPSFTLLDTEGQVIGAAGVIRLWPGTGEAWLLTTPLASRHVIYAFKTARTVLDQIQTSLGLSRVQTILYDREVSLKLADILGFIPESVLEHFYGWGQHGIMATRIQPPKSH